MNIVVPVEVCELVLAKVVLEPGVFKVDPVGVYSAPEVVDSLHMGCVLASGQ